MSKILNQIKEARDSSSKPLDDERKNLEVAVLNNLNSFQDKIVFLCSRLQSLCESLK